MQLFCCANYSNTSYLFIICVVKLLVFWLVVTQKLVWVGYPTYHELKTFVANRITKIQDSIPRSSLFFVPGEQNTADLITRGISPSEFLSTTEKWLVGPDWLKESSEYWPLQAMESVLVPEVLPVVQTNSLVLEKDIVARTTPDLHYNKGITLRYREEFEEALKSFNQASLYDPTWDPPKKREFQLIKYLNDIKELVSTKGKLKTKRLQSLLNSIDSKQLGPYLEDTKNILTGENAKLVPVKIHELKPELNERKVLLGKVVCSVRNEDTVPFTFCLIDETGTCIVVTVFNLADGRGVIIGDSVAIPEPFVTDVDFEYRALRYNFRLIRVERPLLLAVNGKLIQKHQAAGVQMSIFKKCD